MDTRGKEVLNMQLTLIPILAKSWKRETMKAILTSSLGGRIETDVSLCIFDRARKI